MLDVRIFADSDPIAIIAVVTISEYAVKKKITLQNHPYLHLLTLQYPLESGSQAPQILKIILLVMVAHNLNTINLTNIQKGTSLGSLCMAN